jgi:radical SAM superfamily enzyme YgiQ (UPF0313 family)
MKKQRDKQTQAEYGMAFKHIGRTKVALVFPNSYYLGMSSLGFQVILDEFNKHPDVSCQRVFYQESDGVPKSFETQENLTEFDIVAFSVSFELDYFNVASCINNSKIPFWTENRTSKDPLIIAGGICPSFNPEPLADFIDAFLIGDGEEIIHDFLSEYQDGQRLDRQELLARLSEIDGVYVPSLHKPIYNDDGTFGGLHPQANIKRRIVSDLDNFETVSKILTPNTEFSNTFLIEVSRGCVHRCKFCVGSHIQKCRFRSSDAILRLAQSELAKNASKIGLLGSSVTDHPHIDKIVTSLVNNGNRISVASIRADSISDIVLTALASSGLETITLAPEAGSDRLRRIIGKDISLNVIFDVAKTALNKGISGIKLYFMIGLPSENQNDIESIISTITELKKLMMGYISGNKMPHLTVSVSPFVPKPQTPFQWCAMEDEKILTQKLQYIRREIGKIGGIKFTSASAKWSAIQGILARGDRKLGKVLADIQTKKFSWNKSLVFNNLNYEYYLQKIRNYDEILFWDHIEALSSKERLKKQYISVISEYQ